MWLNMEFILWEAIARRRRRPWPWGYGGTMLQQHSQQWTMYSLLLVVHLVLVQFKCKYHSEGCLSH